MIKNHRYELVEFNLGVWRLTQYFDSYDALITFLAKSQRDENWVTGITYSYETYKEYFNVRYYNNEYLDYISMSANNPRLVYDYRGGVYEKKGYLFLRDDDAIVDVRMFFKDILKRHWEIKHKRVKSWRPATPKKGYKFRRGPIQDINKARGGSGYRSAKTGHIVRMVNHPDYIEYNRRPKRLEDFRDAWYEVGRSFERSWKRQKRLKKQWQKHQKTPSKEFGCERPRSLCDCA